MKKRLLITGISGLLGSNVAYRLQDDYEILGLYHSHKVLIDGARTQKVDLTQQGEVKQVVEEFQPDIILHSAAQANVESAEANPEATQKINVDATQYLSESAQEHNIKFIYISTDLVYDGEKSSFTEEDETNPLNCYAKTKLEGEIKALECDGALVLRTNFFGWNIQPKQSLAEWCVAELRQARRIKGFTDAIFSSMYTFHFADVLKKIIAKNLTGVYNCASSSALSKYDFLVKVAEAAGLDQSLIDPISVDEFDFQAKRSKQLCLDVGKLEKDIGTKIPTIEEGITQFVQDLPENHAHLIGVLLDKSQVYPQLNVIPYGRQSLDYKDISSVVETLKSPNITQGPRVDEFEAQLCKLTGARFAVVVNSGTSALHIACMAAGLKQGDEGITSPNSFVASANCIAYCQAKPTFVDIDPETYNIDPALLKEAINEKTKVVIPVHFAGQSCEMDKIAGVVKDAEKQYGHKITLIEDASHALGSSYQGKPVGACDLSDMAVFSFHPVKHITTGEGGAVVTNDEALYQRLKLFRSHGITSDKESLQNKEHGVDDQTDEKNMWYYEQQHLGYNYRITDIQCALGLSQIKRLDQFINRRREIRQMYDEGFKDFKGVVLPKEQISGESNFHLYVLHIDFKALDISRHALMKRLRQEGIITQVHYIPIHYQPFYQEQYGFEKGNYPNTEHYYEGCLSIPFHPSMSDKDVKKVIEVFKSLLFAREEAEVS